LAAKLVDVLRAPFELDGRSVHVSASIGITLFPQDGRSVGDLMKQADQAMYRAKAEGRNRFSYFTAAMQAEALGRLALTEDLRQAQPAGQLQLHFQPIVALATGRTVKAEALLRWQHPQHGPVGPAEFIPLAEESGLIHAMGDWVFEQALQAGQRLREATGALLPINVNKSPRQFAAGETDQRWPGMLAAAQLPPEAVCIEITEGLLLEDRPEVLQRLTTLAQAGLPFALDDFGTGYSAMAYLKKFPIQQLKIDRSFIRDIATDGSDRAIVAAMIAMAHQLGMVVVAEGVETEDQRALLLDAGCDMAQGWLFGRPVPEAELLARLQAEASDVAS
jgi:EAL domain-containing protein (putative c-di-GMP-specific phosphodiesterase class I)